jgi:luciferase family oxidoreductase group 1
MPPISVLDLSPVAAGRSEADAARETVELAVAAERLGYSRFWLAEHHNGGMVASSAPEIMIAAIAARTERIRVGSGGMMLPNHTPLHVAEQFKVLEALHPGRIDLGIGRAPGTDQMTALALRRGAENLNPDLPGQLAELFAFAGIRPWPEGHPFAGVRAAPAGVGLPPIFLLGSSDFSARLAAETGLAFAFAGQINPAAAVEVLRLYRERFRPSESRAEPLAILCHHVLCAEDAQAAIRLSASARVAFRRLRAGAPTPLPRVEEALAEDKPYRPPSDIESMRIVLGSGTGVREVLDELLSRSGADELMVMTSAHGLEDRLRSFELLAEAYSLAATAPAAG